MPSNACSCANSCSSLLVLSESRMFANLQSLHIPAQVVEELVIIRGAEEGAVVIQLPSGGPTQPRYTGQIHTLPGCHK